MRSLTRSRAGAEAAGRRRDRDLLLIADRPAAIAAAFERARRGDVVLLAGKGHEQSIIGPRRAGRPTTRPRPRSTRWPRSGYDRLALTRCAAACGVLIVAALFVWVAAWFGGPPIADGARPPA